MPKIDVTPIVTAAVEVPATNGVEAEAQNEVSDVTLKSPEVQPINGNEDDNDGNSPPESALEQLAKNLEATGKYRDMQNDANEMDMVAFKVFTPNFEMSDYVIGLVESIIGKTAAEQQDFDLTLQIMGKRMMTKHLNRLKMSNRVCFSLRIHSWWQTHWTLERSIWGWNGRANSHSD